MTLDCIKTDKHRVFGGPDYSYTGFLGRYLIDPPRIRRVTCRRGEKRPGGKASLSAHTPVNPSTVGAQWTFRAYKPPKGAPLRQGGMPERAGGILFMNTVLVNRSG